MASNSNVVWLPLGAMTTTGRVVAHYEPRLTRAEVKFLQICPYESPYFEKRPTKMSKRLREWGLLEADPQSGNRLLRVTPAGIEIVEAYRRAKWL